MKCFVLTGDDEWALRAHRAALLTQFGVPAQNVERFDLAEDGGDALARAAATFSLFGGVRLLDADPVEALSVDAARALVAGATDVLVVLRGPGAASAAVKKVLDGHADFAAFRTPTGRAVPGRIAELARAHAVELDPPVRAVLHERGGHDLPRVAGVLAQLASIGLTRPSVAQVERMLGTAAAPGVPWALADALESGDVATALELATSLEPVAVVAYLASRTGQLGRVVDDQLADPDAIAGAFGMASRFPAVKLAALAQRLGKPGVAASWDAVSAADRAVKVAPDPRAALDLLVVRLAGLWGPGAAPAARDALAGARA